MKTMIKLCTRNKTDICCSGYQLINEVTCVGKYIYPIVIDKTYIPCSYFILSFVFRIRHCSCLMSLNPVIQATMGDTVKIGVLLLFTDSTVSLNVSVKRRTVIMPKAVKKHTKQVFLQIYHAWWIFYAWNSLIFMVCTKYVMRNPNVII